SRNVIAAAKLKHALGIKLIALTGEKSDSLAPFADVVVAIPSGATPRIQESHLLVGHILCEWVERQMFPEASIR
ncbi:MAG: phosphoheptose isomerase, partial [Myxococcota bacterium]